MAEVTLPRWALLSLLGALATSSFTAVFLMGRLSATTPRVVPEAPSSSSRDKDTRLEQSADQTTMRPRGPGDLEQPTATAATPTPEPGPPSRASGCPEPTSVVRYLTDMETAVATGKTWDDPTQLAQTIVSDALAGQTDGLDRLVSSSRTVLTQVEAIAPPAACPDCVTHHAETQATLGASLALLASMRDGIATGNLTALMGAQAEAGQLEGRARAIESLDAELRRRCSR